MEEKLLFLNENQRDELLDIYSRLEKINREISCEYEEFPAIKSSLWCINNAIYFREKNL